MKNTEYDTVLEDMRKIADNAETDPKTFCLQTLTFHRRINLYTSLYRNEVEHIRQQITKNEFDSETLQMADKIFESIITVLQNECNRTVDKFEKYIRGKIKGYRNKVVILNFVHQFLQLYVIFSPLILALLIYVSDIPKIIPAIASSSIAIAAAIIKLYKFGERIINLKTAFEDTRREFNLYESRRGPYVGLRNGAALDLCLDKIDEINRKQNELSLSLEKKMLEDNSHLERLVSNDKANKIIKTNKI